MLPVREGILFLFSMKSFIIVGCFSKFRLCHCYDNPLWPLISNPLYSPGNDKASGHYQQDANPFAYINLFVEENDGGNHAEYIAQADQRISCT